MGRCAGCGIPGEIGPEIVILASRDEVHHACWSAFFEKSKSEKNHG